MNLESQFREFLRQIKPTEAQEGSWRAGAKTLQERLSSDPKLKDVVISTFLQGSVRRATAIRPLNDKRPDVDIVVVTNIDYRKTSPEEAMDLFTEFLDKHYAEKWRPQGRSFGITMSAVDMDLVITALPRSDRDTHVRNMAGVSDEASFAVDADLTALYRSEAARSLTTLEEDVSWRLNTGWRQNAVFDELGRSGERTLASKTAQVMDDAPPEGWKDNPLWLPDRDTKEWGRTHPLRQISWTASKNRRTNC